MPRIREDGHHSAAHTAPESSPHLVHCVPRVHISAHAQRQRLAQSMQKSGCLPRPPHGGGEPP